MNIIEKGIDYKNVGWGLVAIGIGVAAILAGAIGNFTLRISRIVLPTWSMYVIGAIAGLIGIVLVKTSLNAEKCTACNAALENGEAYFSLDEEESVIKAAQDLNGGLINELPKQKERGTAISLDVDYCPKCREVAKLTVKEFQNYNSKVLVEERTVKDSKVTALVDVVEAHENFRDND